MKKVIKKMVLALSMLVILNIGLNTINMKDFNNQSNNIVKIQSEIEYSSNLIDPDSERG